MKELKIVKKSFLGILSEKLNLLSRKGEYPYKYIDSIEKLEETELSAIEDFYGKLNGCHISQDDYYHAQKVWDALNCQTLLDYLLLYMELDIRMLADISEEFCDNSMSAYKLDAAHYLTAPGLAYDTMLKCTGVELELLDDIEMVTLWNEELETGSVNVATDTQMPTTNT